MSDESYDKGKTLVDAYNPGMEEALMRRYEALVPGMARSVVDFAWGQQYARDGLDIKTRWLVTVGALTALGGQTKPQLKVNIAAARKAGASQREIGEAIWQMAIYGGFPAAINGLNAALEVFEAEDGAHSDD